VIRYDTGKPRGRARTTSVKAKAVTFNAKAKYKAEENDENIHSIKS